ncbi:MAG: hypothetical protein ACTSX7_14810 [Alphaproteobacteria bacterium]
MWQSTNLSPFRHAINAVLFAVVLALGFAIFSPNASAASNCAIHDDIVKLLGSRYAETPSAMGLSTSGAMVEIFSTKDGSTWTILATQANGTTCIVTSGQRWVPVIPTNLATQQPVS